METMLCPKCNSSNIEKNGTRNDKQRYHCKDCDKYFGESTNRIPIETQFIAVWLSDERNIAPRVIAKMLGIKSHNSIIYWRDRYVYSIRYLSDDNKEKIREKANEIIGRLDIVCEYNELCKQIQSTKREIQNQKTSFQYNPKYIEQLKADIEDLQRKISNLEAQEKVAKKIDDKIKIQNRLRSRRDYLNVQRAILYQCEHAPQQKRIGVIEKKLIGKLNKLTQQANEIKSRYEEMSQQSVDEYKFYANRICEKLKQLLRALKK